MFHFLKTAAPMAWMQPLACLVIACGTASAQDFSLRVADPNPLGIGNFVPSSLDLAESAEGMGAIKGDFLYGIGMNTSYDSNFFLTEDNEEDEVSYQLQPWLSYTSDPEGGASFVFNANYRPVYVGYLNNADLNDFNQSADVSLSWIGGRTQVSVFTSYQQLTGTDRLSGAFVSGSIFSGGLRATRQIAPRTSLNGALTYSQSDYSSGNQEGTQVFTGSFGGLWTATERTAIGSSISYSQTESDNTGTRDALALHGELRYQVGERIWLSASLGPQFTSDSESDENDVAVSGNISARYMLNERWSWTNSFGTGTVASPSDTGYLVNNYNFTTGLEHQLVRGSINGGLSFDYSDYQSVSDVLVEREDEENMSLFLAYSRDLWSERLMFNSSVRYRINSGDLEWSQWVLSAGLNIPF
jgi:hypothetical protein